LYKEGISFIEKGESPLIYPGTNIRWAGES